jgi:hypothetical protein
MTLSRLILLATVISCSTVAQTPEGTRLPVPGKAIPVDVLVEAPAAAPGDLQIVCLFASTPENKLEASLALLDAKLSGALTTVRTPNLFRGTLGETLLITPNPGAISAKRLLLIGLGDRDTFTPDREELIGEIAYAESERLGVAAPTFAPTILDGGKTGIATGTVGAAFLSGFLRARAITLALHKPLVVQRLTFLAGTAHAVDTQRGMASK